MKMKFTVANILFVLPLITSVKISYNTLSYNNVPDTGPAYNTRLPWHVCPAFPHCAQDPASGLWYSDPTVSWFRLPNKKITHTYYNNKELQADFTPRDSDDSVTNCMFEEEYCSITDYIVKYESDDVESASKCQQFCENNADCKFWTFLTLRGKTTCSLLKECSAKTKCPASDKLSCASGPKKCTCPALVKTGGGEEDSKYARWNCGDSSYGKELDVGTKCTATCGNWRNAKNEIIVVESECLLGGDWSTTRDIAGQALTYANYYSWAKPSEDDMKCGCDTITVSAYDPNSEAGADFVCEESKDFSGEWQLTTRDQCVLYCNKDIAATFECVDGAWVGEPERGFWCYTDPQVEVKVGRFFLF